MKIKSSKINRKKHFLIEYFRQQKCHYNLKWNMDDEKSEGIKDGFKEKGILE